MKSIFDELSNANESWVSIPVGTVNSAPITARVMEDFEAPFHTHDNADEFFLVVSGTVFIDTGSETIQLNKGQSYTVSAGACHRAKAAGRAELIVIGGNNA